MATYRGTNSHDFMSPDHVSPGVTSDGAPTPQNNIFDYLYGFDGDDNLSGGLGGDYMDGGAGNDSYDVDSTGDQVHDSAGIDWVWSYIGTYTLSSVIENLFIGGMNGKGFGNAKDNTIIGSSSANVLNGLGGADHMDGGDGNDTYYVNHTGDTVYENTCDSDFEYCDPLSGGVDKVISTISYVLPYMIENLSLQGTAAINATGNAIANALVGNSGSNILTGGLGADRLNGAAGDDYFDFNAISESNGTTRDRILSFQFGTSTTGDRIDVSGIDADTSLAGNQAFKWGGTVNKSKAYLWAENSATGDTVIKGNVDGDADAEFQVAVADGTTTADSWLSAEFIL